MSDKMQWQAHPSNPACQPFSVGARPNKTKTRAWWAPMSDTYWRNRGKKNKGGAHVAVEG